MRAAIIGSRSFNNYKLVLETLLGYENTITVIVSGGAKGADTLGERWAKEKNKETLIFYPDWGKYGRSAGFIRNKDIIENSDIVFAFWDGKSKGTKSSIDLTIKLNKELKIINYNMDLNKIAIEIREILEKRRQELELTFVEDIHTYTMKNSKGELKSDWPSVSKVMKYFYDEFDSEGISLKKAQGDPIIQKQLLDEWAAAGEYATNMGSRVHFLLEKEVIDMFGGYKEVRQPIFECDFTQILKGDSMVSAGTNYLNLMVERGAVLLDTEIVLGDPELGYTGQPDKVWLIMNKDQSEFGLVITDWKTNKKKNFEESHFTTRMKHPFQKLPNNALGHYFTQLPFYGKLLFKMLQGSKYENIKLYGCIVVLVKDDGTFEEFRIPKEVQQTILDMDIKKYLTK
jgi:hypothetical protein